MWWFWVTLGEELGYYSAAFRLELVVMRRYSHGKKISKNQKVYPHHFGYSQNHTTVSKNPILVLLGDFHNYQHLQKNLTIFQNVYALRIFVQYNILYLCMTILCYITSGQKQTKSVLWLNFIYFGRYPAIITGSLYVFLYNTCNRFNWLSTN